MSYGQMPNQGLPGGQPGPGIRPQMPQMGPQQGMTPPAPQMGMAPPAPPMGMPPQPGATPDQDNSNQFDIVLQKINIAEKLDEDKLKEIGAECKEGYETDEASRKDWVMATSEWLKLAGQTREKKTYPWPDASNIKYPLISTASMQFSARAYPSLIPPDGNIVQAQVWGNDPDGQKTQLGDRIGKYMSWQLMQDLDYWEEDMDKLLMQISIVGMMHKKTFYCRTTEKIESVLVFPENFVVDYWTPCLEESERISEVMYMSKNQIKEKVLNEEFLDIDLGGPQTPPNPLMKDMKNNKKSTDWTTPYRIIEQHTWLDLNDDGLREPYIVTFDYASAKVLRIQARYTKDGVKVDKKGKPICYTPLHYYTKFGFIPNPDGSYYDLGFGHLLGPLNEGINSILNQLIDAGTLSNLQVGFIGKGLRMKMGTSSFQPGEWKAVNATGDDLRKQIVPLPTKEPSNVLFQLLGMLITSGKELASVAEIFTGKMPGQNTPATTTMATIEQGMKVFTAIYKRVYRSLGKEYKKIFDLNKLYLDKDTYLAVLGTKALNPEDFDPEVFDVCPTADPTATTQTEKLLKAQALMELMQAFGDILPRQLVLKRMLEAQEQPNYAELVPGMQQTGQPAPPPPPPPDPKVLAIQEKAKAEQAKVMIQQQAAAQDAQREQQSQQQELQFKAQEHAMNIQMKQAELQQDAQIHHAKMSMEMASNQQQLRQNEQTHQMGLMQQQQSHEAGLAQQKEAAQTKNEVMKSTASQKKTSSSGGQTK